MGDTGLRCELHLLSGTSQCTVRPVADVVVGDLPYKSMGSRVSNRPCSAPGDECKQRAFADVGAAIDNLDLVCSGFRLEKVGC